MTDEERNKIITDLVSKYTKRDENGNPMYTKDGFPVITDPKALMDDMSEELPLRTKTGNYKKKTNDHNNGFTR